MNSRDVVEDPNGLTSSADHDGDMEKIALEVISLSYPFPSVCRVTGTIAPKNQAQWLYPNLAVRLDVELSADGRAINRIYTIADFRPETNQIDIDFVLHKDDSPAMRWIRSAKAGTRVMMKGPREHLVPNHAAGRPVAIFADDTAIPAVRAMLRAWPKDGARGQVWIDSNDADAFASLIAPEGVDLHRLDSGSAPLGSLQLLLKAAKTHLTTPADWTVWAAGERKEMQELRNFLRDGGLGREDMRLLGYWRMGQSSSDLDRERLAVYERLRAAGLGIEEMRDLETQP